MPVVSGNPSLGHPPADAHAQGQPPRGWDQRPRVCILGRDRRLVVARGTAALAARETFQGVRVGFQGKPGAYSEIACEKAFPGCVPAPYRVFSDVFKALSEGEVDQALLPMENSTGGSVHDVYLLLPKYGLHVVGEYSLGVEHCLLTHPSTDVSSIKRVFSHWQALAQCAQYCERMGYQMVEHDDTAGAAAMISANQHNDAAAIASSRAAEIYELDVKAKGIQDKEDNYTRFVGLSNAPSAPPCQDPSECKTTIAFACRDGAGGLQELLSRLLALGINLEKIEPQAMLNEPLIDAASGRKFNYLFVADFKGSIAEPKFDQAFELFEEYTGYYRVFGSYRRHAF
eukprot:evm.model.scf_717.2 EVM.evm.TU.scf_717.2   scf_717:15936-18581(-)